jgi:hypothetical protein
VPNAMKAAQRIGIAGQRRNAAFIIVVSVLI